MHPTLLEVTEEFTITKYDSISHFNKEHDFDSQIIYLQNMWNRDTSVHKDYELFISAPFGNWIKHKNAISTTGTWTLHPRGNRFVSVMKSLRWNEDLQGWCNALRLG